jgi:hypothetical protein
MTTPLQDNFLRQASAAAHQSGHIFPEYAACEAALESNWGQSRLAREANNLFGQKQSANDNDGAATIAMPTQEFLRGRWFTVVAHWARFADQAACFRARMALLHRLQQNYPGLHARPLRRHRRNLHRRGLARLVHRSATRRQGPGHPPPALLELPAYTARQPFTSPRGAWRMPKPNRKTNLAITAFNGRI